MRKVQEMEYVLSCILKKFIIKINTESFIDGLLDTCCKSNNNMLPLTIWRFIISVTIRTEGEYVAYNKCLNMTILNLYTIKSLATLSGCACERLNKIYYCNEHNGVLQIMSEIR